jgi:hypothetical protein
MKVICAWCQREGRSGLLREREPLEDPSETHGICLRHQQQVVATLPSQSFPDVRLLIVVRPDEWALYDYLRKTVGELKGVRVMVDRRQAERRREGSARGRERRRGDRRLPDREVRLLGCTIVRFGMPSTPVPPAPPD